MSTPTPSIRYEVGTHGQGADDWWPTLGDALSAARELARGGGRAYVYDRMARRGQPCLWDVPADGPAVIERRREHEVAA